jgi:hypothetical protein
MNTTNPTTFRRIFTLVCVVSLIFSLSPLSAMAAVTTQTWTGHLSAGESNIWQDVVWSPELDLFVAVSFNGTNRVMTSPDGATWTARVSSNESNSWCSVAWSSSLSLFVAVACSGTNRVMTSPDGINWTARTSANETNGWRDVVWSPELGIFVAVAQGGTNRVMTSPDGINWTARTSSGESNAWFGVTWSPQLGLFAAVSWDGTNRVMTSPDGINWTQRASGNDSNGWLEITWSPELNLFAAVAYTGTNRVMTSPDGINLTARTSSGETNSWYNIAWSPELGIFTATALFGTNQIMTSPDGINWTARTPATIGMQWRAIRWAPDLGIFVSLSQSGTNRTMTSDLTAPVISSISSGTPGATSATITWTTDISSSSQVNYGLTSGYGSSTTLDSTLTKSHSVTVSGLTCATTYNFQVSSTYVGQNTLSGDNTFTTAACPVSAPTVTVSAASPVTTTTATLNGNITAINGANASSYGFNYGLDGTYGTTVTTTASLGVSAFTYDITGLTCNTTYHYQSFATNTGGTGTSSDTTFATSSCPTAVSGGRGRPRPAIIPTGPNDQPLGFKVNGGAKAITSPVVRVSLVADPRTVTGYSVSFNPSFKNGIILPYVPETMVVLPQITGAQTLYVKYFSPTGDTSNTLSETVAYAKPVLAPSKKVTSPAVPPGMSKADVLVLQKFLNTHGFTIAPSGPGSPGKETGVYGALTRIAFQKYQAVQLEKNTLNITPTNEAAPPSSLVKQGSTSVMNPAVFQSASVIGADR